MAVRTMGFNFTQLPTMAFGPKVDSAVLLVIALGFGFGDSVSAKELPCHYWFLICLQISASDWSLGLQLAWYCVSGIGSFEASPLPL